MTPEELRRLRDAWERAVLRYQSTAMLPGVMLDFGRISLTARALLAALEQRDKDRECDEHIKSAQEARDSWDERDRDAIEAHGAKKPYCEHAGDSCLCDEYETNFPCVGHPKTAPPKETVESVLESVIRYNPSHAIAPMLHEALRLYRAERERDRKRRERLEGVLDWMAHSRSVSRSQSERLAYGNCVELLEPIIHEALRDG